MKDQDELDFEEEQYERTMEDAIFTCAVGIVAIVCCMVLFFFGVGYWG